MRRAFFCVFVSLVSFVVSAPLVAHAQPSDAIGIRAQGMGGAFTAVADDATAAWWNPGGLAAGAYFSAILETATQRQPTAETAVPAWKTGTRGFSVAYPALALSYYRLRVSGIEPSGTTAGGSAGRQDGGSADVRLSSLVVSQYGVTVGQSMGNHLVVASTLKVVRAGVGREVRSGDSASLDAADELEIDSETHPGLDVGAMAKFGTARIGLMVRNARESTFGTGDLAVTLDLHVRAGVALSAPSGRVTVAGDVDLMKTTTTTGEERRWAAGAEVWAPARWIGVRGGVSASTIGEARPTASGGVSVAFRQGTFMDVAAMIGSDEARRGWGLALRVTF